MITRYKMIAALSVTLLFIFNTTACKANNMISVKTFDNTPPVTNEVITPDNPILPHNKIIMFYKL